MGYKEAVMETFPRNVHTDARLHTAIRRFSGSLFLTAAHYQRMERMKVRQGYRRRRDTPAYYAAMYLLTANEDICTRAANCFCRYGIEFDYATTQDMAYFYAHSTGVFTDQAKALGVDDVWDSNYTWTMNSWTQAIVWRYKAGLLSDPVTACAEELLCVYNNLEHTNYSSIDDKMDGKSFRDRAQYILDLGAQGVWGECEVYEYAYTGPGSSYHPSNDVQAVMVGKLDITHEEYTLTVKKVDSTNPNKGLSGARFLVASENGAYSKEVVTGADGTATLYPLVAGTYAVTELEAPAGYEIDNAGPQYVVLPSNGSTTVTVTFTDTPEITGEGSIRKVDADDPTKGLAGAVIKITGVDNGFTGTYVTGAGGYLTDVPWKDMPLGSYTAEEITPPGGLLSQPGCQQDQADLCLGRQDRCSPGV